MFTQVISNIKIGHIEMACDISNKWGIFENKGVVFETNVVIFKNSGGRFGNNILKWGIFWTYYTGQWPGSSLAGT